MTTETERYREALTLIDKDCVSLRSAVHIARDALGEDYVREYHFPDTVDEELARLVDYYRTRKLPTRVTVRVDDLLEIDRAITEALTDSLTGGSADRLARASDLVNRIVQQKAKW